MGALLTVCVVLGVAVLAALVTTLSTGRRAPAVPSAWPPRPPGGERVMRLGRWG